MPTDLKINAFHALGAVQSALGLAETVRLKATATDEARDVPIALDGPAKRLTTVVVQAPAVRVTIGGESFWVAIIAEPTEGAPDAV